MVLKDNKLLIIGGDGQIGKCLRSFFSEKKINFFFTSRKYKKFKNIIIINFKKKNLQKIIKAINKYDTIFYCLALEDINYCQKNPEESFFINFFLPYYLIKNTKSKFILFQTDIKNNKNINYAKDKLRLEKKVKNLSSRIKIITIAKFIDKNNPFIKKIKKFINKNKIIFIKKNIRFYITTSLNLKSRLFDFLENKKKKITIINSRKYNYYSLVLKHYSELDINLEKFKGHIKLK